MKRVTIGAIVVATSAAFAMAAPAASETGVMQVNGVELSYVEQGEGEPIVFVHGAISDARVWEGYAERAARAGRFIAYTQRYFGTADWPDDGADFSRETHVSDLIGFVEGLDAGPVDLVTWSYSGEVATYAALRRPDLFRSMVHFEPAMGGLLEGIPGAGAAAAQFGAGLGPALGALGEGDVEAAALRFIEAVFRMPEGAADTEPAPFPDYWRENGRTLPPFVSMAPGAALSCDDLGRIMVPTLVVLGTDTLVQFAMESERLAQCAGNAVLVRMEGVTHDGPYRRPDRFADLALGFRALTHEAAGDPSR